MIRKITESDRTLFLELTDEFYNSPAVLHPVDKKFYDKTFLEVISGSPYADAFIIESDCKTAGYGLVAKTYTSEAGTKVLLIEEIYIREEFRSKGLGREYFTFLEETFPDFKRFRLEVEPYNTRAISLYEKLGFESLPYKQMIRDRK